MANPFQKHIGIFQVSWSGSRTPDQGFVCVHPHNRVGRRENALSVFDNHDCESGQVMLGSGLLM
jgi:hypothetical protein